MSSREKILATVQANQPNDSPLPELHFSVGEDNHVDRFKTVLSGIGGNVVEVADRNQIHEFIKLNFSESKRIVNTIPDLAAVSGIHAFENDPHRLEDVDLAILQGHFGVAENGAIWITEDRMGDRALPFITQHLALVIDKKEIVPNLHEAYFRLDTSAHQFGTFIAGPSKTADIEQSLVLGAHGPKSLLVFLIGQ